MIYFQIPMINMAYMVFWEKGQHLHIIFFARHNQCHYLNNFLTEQTHHKATQSHVHTAWSACKLYQYCWCCNTTNNFVSQNTVGLKAQMQHVVGFEITAILHCGNLCTGIPHKTGQYKTQTADWV